MLFTGVYALVRPLFEECVRLCFCNELLLLAKQVVHAMGEKEG